MTSSISTADASQPERLFPGDSEMACRMRALDWTATDFGPPEKWPENLRVAVSLCLPSRFPIVLCWGPKFNMLYNDAYLPWLTEAKHPRALARPTIESWPEIWDEIGPTLTSVLKTGQATWSENTEQYYARRLPKEEVYITYTHAPILAADGQTAEGIFVPVTETTEQIVGARRLETLRKLGLRSKETRTVEAACQQAAAVLRENQRDISFAAIYLTAAAGTEAFLSAAVLPEGDSLLPRLVSLSPEDESHSPWPLVFVLRTKEGVEIGDLGSLGVQIAGSVWPEPVSRAIVLPIHVTPDTLAGLLVLGVGTRRPWDAAYRTFFDLVAGHIGSAIADARAYEEERRRAEALAEIDRAKTVFFSNVSHEFRTPLTLMLGSLEDVLAKPDEEVLPENREILIVAHRNALRLLKLVNSLLDFSRIEAGRMQASYQPTDLAALTADLASSFRSAMEKAGLRLRVDCPALAQTVCVDREMWEKVVLNLISNAFKFTFEGEIAVTLRSSADGAAAELTVRDTGTGIPASELPRLFERFHRVQGARSRTYEGTGIGLALVQELVKLHGGRISVDSRPDCGSAFTVQIPFGDSHLLRERIGARSELNSTATKAEAYVEEAVRWLPDSPIASEWAPEERPSSAAMAHEEPSGRRSRVLLVDDNADMRDYLASLLIRHYDVTAAINGKEALELACSDPPDLVLTDVMMPVLDGIGLLQALRAHPATHTLPVILLSARAGEEVRVQGLAARADDYLVKPFTARELLARVEVHLSLSRMRRQAEKQAQAVREQLAYIARVGTMGELAATIAHEINQPLAALVTYTRASLQWLSQSPPDVEEARIALAEVVGHGHRAAEVITRIRATIGKNPPVLSNLNPNALIAEAAALVHEELAQCGIAMSLELASDLPTIEGDSVQLQQVLLNLILNAIEAINQAEEGPRRVVVRSQCASGEVEVAVQDSGFGIDASQVDQLFKPFFTTKACGTGMGLAICHSIIEAHGGRLWATSNLTRGATFHFSLRAQRGI